MNVQPNPTKRVNKMNVAHKLHPFQIYRRQ